MKPQTKTFHYEPDARLRLDALPVRGVSMYAEEVHPDKHGVGRLVVDTSFKLDNGTKVESTVSLVYHCAKRGDEMEGKYSFVHSYVIQPETGTLRTALLQGVEVDKCGTEWTVARGIVYALVDYAKGV